MSEVEAVPAEFWDGIEQFNCRQFYDCHDTLEAIWMEAAEPDRTFYQGVLQIAVAFYHLQNQNWRGAVVLLGEGMSRLQRYWPTYAGLDVDRLLTESEVVLRTLQQRGPEPIAEYLNDPTFVLPTLHRAT